MKTYKIIKTEDSEVGPEPRTAGRRYIDTEFRIDHARKHGASPKRMYLLETGYAMLDKEFDAEVRRDIKNGLLDHLGPLFNAQAHSHLLTRPS